MSLLIRQVIAIASVVAKETVLLFGAKIQNAGGKLVDEITVVGDSNDGAIKG